MVYVTFNLCIYILIYAHTIGSQCKPLYVSVAVLESDRHNPPQPNAPTAEPSEHSMVDRFASHFTIGNFSGDSRVPKCTEATARNLRLDPFSILALERDSGSSVSAQCTLPFQDEGEGSKKNK